MRSIQTTILLFLAIMVSTAQDLAYESYSWDVTPAYDVDATNEEGIIGIKDITISEFGFLPNDEGFVEYILEHKVYWLNSDDKIEQFNKIYLPFSSNSDLLKSKARVISPSGKIIELDESKILTAEDEETKRQVKYFALEGIEKGGYVEYWYALRRYPKYQGEYVRLQDEFRKKNVTLKVLSPKNLVFSFKSYNGLENMGEPQEVGEKLVWTMSVDNMEALDREDLSAYDASRKAIAYKLDKNTATNVTGIVSYKKIVENIEGVLTQEYSKKTQKAIGNFLKSGNIKSGSDIEKTLHDLDYHIKSTIYFVDGGNDNLKNLDFVLENKAGSDYGLIQLYAQCLEVLDIDYQLVLTSDRTNKAFDKDYEALGFLEEFLMYFPETGKYLEPANEDSRYGFPDYNLTDNYGLFIKEVTLGDFKSLVGSIEYIDSVPAEASLDKMQFDVSFDKADPTISYIKMKHAFEGYPASYIQPYLNLIKEDVKEEIFTDFVKRMGENITIKDKTITNATSQDFGENPIIVEANVESESFVDKAGNKYLFRIGELIGRQTEMYQEKTRKLPVDNGYRKLYLRTLNVQIPEGYKISNLDDINILNEYKEDGKLMMNFDSHYEMDGNILRITANEVYDDNLMPVELYETYRKVINSAADFNKLTLILEPVEN